MPILNIGFGCLIWFALLNCSASAQQIEIEGEDISIFKTAPSISGHNWLCADMVDVVNYLRKLGKDKSLAVLRQYLTNGGDGDKILVICRLLFVNPKGWNPPILGEPVPAIDQASAKQFPLFPIGLSDGLPFLLIRGYRLEGKAESGIECLKLCQSLSLVKQDYPSTGYEKAARALVQSDSFRQLYDEADREEMADMILQQAKKAEQPEKK